MKTLNDLAADCPPDVVARLDECVEVAPGVRKRFGDCTMEDVAGCLEASQEGMLNQGEIAGLLQRAMEANVTVPSQMLARLTAAETGPAVIAVRNELRDLLSSR